MKRGHRKQRSDAVPFRIAQVSKIVCSIYNAYSITRDQKSLFQTVSQRCLNDPSSVFMPLFAGLRQPICL